MPVRVTCIKKDNGNHQNPYEAINTLTWINEETKVTNTSTRLQMYEWVKAGGVAFVRDSKGNIGNLIAEISLNGTKYVRTKPDSTKTDNLLSLPECK